jgi:transposase
MSKSDLRARPIFHHLKDSIEAHLTVVMVSLAIGKIIEKKTGLSIKRFVKTLRPIRSGTILLNGEEYPVEAKIPESVASLLNNLNRGH